MKLKHLYLFLTGIFILLILNSCYKELNTIPSEVTVKGTIALPLVSVELGANQVLRINIPDSILLDSLLQIQISSIFRDTIDYKMSSLVDKPEYIKSIDFNFFTWNEFPCNISAKVYFCNSEVVPFDSLILFNCKPSLLSSSGEILEQGFYKISPHFDILKIDSLLKTTEYIIIHSQTNNIDINDAFFQYCNNFKIKTFLNMKAEFEYKVN